MLRSVCLCPTIRDRRQQLYRTGRRSMRARHTRANAVHSRTDTIANAEADATTANNTGSNSVYDRRHMRWCVSVGQRRRGHLVDSDDVPVVFQHTGRLRDSEFLQSDCHLQDHRRVVQPRAVSGGHTESESVPHTILR